MMPLLSSGEYCLRLTETFQRFYYSAEPVLTGTETREYPLLKDTEIFTSCGFLAVSSVIFADGHIIGAQLDYFDDNGQTQSVSITPDASATVRLTEGEGSVYRTADCLFEIVRM
jgi:hypothetical protein